MIDEYQDTNRPQYELMKLLAGPEKNICVVGDEDQSIYSWRGADIKNILDFEKDFPNGKTIRLEQNYRSTQVILEGASAVVAQNTQRKGKNLWTSREGGSLIGYYEAPDGENEALFIADRIQRYLREAGQQEDEPRCAVLYRTNSQSRLVEEALRRYQIQYHMVGGFSFYDRSEVKDLLSYLKLVQNPHDSIALQRVVNSPARGIGKTTMETLERMALSTGLSTWDAMARAMEDRLLPQRTLNALEGFRRLIEDARAMLGAGFAEKLTEDVQRGCERERCARLMFRSSRQRRKRVRSRFRAGECRRRTKSSIRASTSPSTLGRAKRSRRLRRRIRRTRMWARNRFSELQSVCSGGAEGGSRR